MVIIMKTFEFMNLGEVRIFVKLAEKKVDGYTEVERLMNDYVEMGVDLSEDEEYYLEEFNISLKDEFEMMKIVDGVDESSHERWNYNVEKIIDFIKDYRKLLAEYNYHML